MENQGLVPISGTAISDQRTIEVEEEPGIIVTILWGRK